MRRGQPNYSTDERALLETMDPEFETEDDRAIDKETKLRMELAKKQNLMEGIADELYGTAEGLGYIRAPNAKGYLAPPNGGFLPFLPLIAGIASILGSGKRGGRMPKQYRLDHPLPLTSASSFYRDLVHQATGQGMSHKRLVKLFGTKENMNSILKGKVGGSTPQNLQVGHLLMPLLRGHFAKMKIDPNNSLLHLEKIAPDILQQPVSMKHIAKGGSILSWLWNGAKNLLRKFIGNPTVQNIGQKVVGKVGEVAEKRAPELAEMASNRVADYLTKKMKRDEPEEEEEEEEYEPPVRKPPVRKPVDVELPSGRSNSALRRELVEQRRERRIVPREPEAPAPAPAPERRIIGYRRGMPMYGDGKKKGGSWTIKLQRS